MKKTNFIFLAASLSALFSLPLGGSGWAQNIAINTTGTAGNASAMLDVSATNKGILIPRMALTSSTDGATIASPANSLLVYNTGTGGLTPAGYYYNSGTPAAPTWKQLITPQQVTSTCPIDACPWTLVAVANGNIPGTGTFSSGYTVPAGKEVMVVVFDLSGFDITLLITDNVTLFEHTAAAGIAGANNGQHVAIISDAFSNRGSAGFANTSASKIMGRRIGSPVPAGSVRFTLITSNGHYATIDGAGLISLFDGNGGVDSGLYIFER